MGRRDERRRRRGGARARAQHHASVPRGLVVRDVHRRRHRSGGRRSRRPHRRALCRRAGLRDRDRSRGEPPTAPLGRDGSRAGAGRESLGLARTPHAGDRFHGLGLHPRGGLRQRLARARADRRVRRAALGRRPGICPLRGVDDTGPARGSARARPLRSGALHARLGSRGDRRCPHRGLGRRRRAGRGRHRAVGVRGRPRLPGRDERRRRRPGPRGAARQRRLDDRVRRLPGRPSPPRIRRRPRGHPAVTDGDRRRDGARHRAGQLRASVPAPPRRSADRVVRPTPASRPSVERTTQRRPQLKPPPTRRRRGAGPGGWPRRSRGGRQPTGSRSAGSRRTPRTPRGGPRRSRRS